MDNIYSKLYTGQTKTYDQGPRGSKPVKLKHSSSMPYFTSKSNYPPILSEQLPYKRINNTNLSNNSNQKWKLPIIESISRKKRYITKSSEHSSYNYNRKSRNELSNYMQDINNNISSRLQNDNFIAQQKLNNLKNNYNEMKILLNNKIEKLEQEQRMQYENLKRSIEQGGGLKMMGAGKNSNGGNIYDLRRAEEEDMIDATKRLPRLLEDKLNIINNMKRKEKEDEKRLLSQVRRKVNEELKKQKEKDEMRFKREIDDIEHKRENIRKERRRLIEELQNRDIEESESGSLNPQPIYSQNIVPKGGFPSSMYPNQMSPMMPPYSFPPNMYPMNNNNNKDSIEELLKIFILKKIFDDKPQPILASPQMQPIPQYIPNPYSQPQYPIYQQPNQYQQSQPQQQPLTVPQPIIYQSPQSVVPSPNVIIQQDRAQPQIQPQIIQPQMQYKDIVITKNDTNNSGKKYPFIDPLEEYLKETRTLKKKSYSKAKNKSTRKKTTIKESKEDEESNPEPIKLKSDDKKSTKNKEKTSKKDSKAKTKTKDSKKTKKTDSKATKKSNKSKSKKKTEPKEPAKPAKKKAEEEEEYDEEEEEEEDDEEEEGEEEDDEGEELEDDANERIIRKKKK